MEIIEYRVNEVAQETHDRTLTARQILRHAEIDAELHFLEETHPEHISFQDKPDAPIEMIAHMRFKTERQSIHYKVNDEPEETRHHHLTAREILTNAGIDPVLTYLSEVFARHQSFEGKPEERIEMHPQMRFISVSIKPTPVSEL